MHAINLCEVITIKIGKDEIGAVGIIGLILIALGAITLAALWFFIGLGALIVGAIIYYSDLMNHRKKPKQTSS